MHRVSWVAFNVFRESVRDKVLYNLVVFAVLLIGASYVVGLLTAGQEVKIVKDLGLAATTVFGLFIAVLIGIGLVSKEVERRSIYSLLAKPITRSQFILGKYAGLVLTLIVNISVMTLALYVVLGVISWWDPLGVGGGGVDAPALDPAMLKAVVLILGELMIVTAIALFFSTFSTPVLAAALTAALYIIGHLSGDLRNIDSVIEAKPIAWTARAFYYILPNLAPFDVKAEVVHAQHVPWAYLGLTLAYGFAYIGILLAAAAFIFSRRDFK